MLKRISFLFIIFFIFFKVVMASGPTAVLDVPLTIGTEETFFEILVSHSLNSVGTKTNLLYRYKCGWLWENNKKWTDWKKTINKKDWCTFNKIGETAIILEVTDTTNELTDRVQQKIIIKDASERTVAINGCFLINEDCLEGNVDQEYKFVIAAYSPIGTRKNEFSYRMDFDGDNIWDTEFFSNNIFYHTYIHVGIKFPKVEVKDKDGSSFFGEGVIPTNGGSVFVGDAHSIIIRATEMPEANITASSTQINAGKTITFSASSSVLNKAEKLYYYWDFDNDGIWDYEGSNKIVVSYQYTIPGNYLVVLTIKNEKWVSNTTTLNVTVAKVDNNKPNIDFEIKPGNSGTANTEFTFDASDSFDFEKSKLEYSWDFNNDGIWDLPYSSNNKKTTKTFYSLGEKTVTLKIKDEAGNFNQISKIINLVKNSDPIAILKMDNTLTIGTTKTEWSFNATESYDNETSYNDLEYAWDLNGDKELDIAWTRGKNKVKYIFPKKGKKNVTVFVRDEDSTIDYKSLIVEIVDSTSPILWYNIASSKIRVGTKFDLNLCESYDLETEIKDLEFRVDWDYQLGDVFKEKDRFSKRCKLTTRYKEEGLKKIKIQIKDPEDKMTEKILEIKVLPKLDSKYSQEIVTVNNDKWPNIYYDVSKATVFKEEKFDIDLCLSTNKEVNNVDKIQFRIAWDYIEGDENNLFTKFSNNCNFKFSYPKDTPVGYHQVVIQAKDSQGNVSEKKLEINVNWASDYVYYLQKKRITSRKYEVVEFQPEVYINRAEILKMSLKAKNINSKIDFKTNPFEDINSKNWFYKDVLYAYQEKIIEGYSQGEDLYFYPNYNVTRAQWLKIILETYGVSLFSSNNFIYKDVGNKEWFSKYVAFSKDKDLLLTWNDYFYPNKALTRAEVAKIIYKLNQRETDKKVIKIEE